MSSETKIKMQTKNRAARAQGLPGNTDSVTYAARQTADSSTMADRNRGR